uniref:Uncharacterized protein n=1 Tax=Steinernema glaseri TaxID=37863 RepID=A0A1I7Y0B1_9BILA
MNSIGQPIAAINRIKPGAETGVKAIKKENSGCDSVIAIRTCKPIGHTSLEDVKGFIINSVHIHYLNGWPFQRSGALYSGERRINKVNQQGRIDGKKGEENRSTTLHKAIIMNKSYSMQTLGTRKLGIATSFSQ